MAKYQTHQKASHLGFLSLSLNVIFSKCHEKPNQTEEKRVSAHLNATSTQDLPVAFQCAQIKSNYLNDVIYNL